MIINLNIEIYIYKFYNNKIIVRINKHNELQQCTTLWNVITNT